MIDKSLESLRPPCRLKAEQLLRLVKDELGIDARVHETLRSLERQDAVETAGASKNKVGWHNFGLALDIGCYVDGKFQEDDAKGLYLKCGFIGMALGFRWGGNWDQDRNIAEAGENDFGHFEYHPGSTLQQLIAQEGLKT
jgi:hypothetical protein